MRKLVFLIAAVALAQRPWQSPGMRCAERVVFMLAPSRADAASKDPSEAAEILAKDPLVRDRSMDFGSPRPVVWNACEAAN